MPPAVARGLANSFIFSKAARQPHCHRREGGRPLDPVHGAAVPDAEVEHKNVADGLHGVFLSIRLSKEPPHRCEQPWKLKQEMKETQ